MSQIFKPHTVNSVSQVPDIEIGWRSTPSTNVDFLLERRWSTVVGLSHQSNPACGDLRNKTWSLICTDFRMNNLPNVITGLSLALNTQRNGRIVDEVIQLTYQNEPIGGNNFVYITDSDGHLKITNESTYGGPTDLWGAALTPEILQDPSFGIILKFQSHPYYPHKCGIFVDSVSFTVY